MVGSHRYSGYNVCDLLVQSSVDGLPSFQFGAVADETAVTSLVQVFVDIHFHFYWFNIFE